MYDLYLASGILVLLAGVFTSVYLVYSLYVNYTGQRKTSSLVILSETLVSVAIGISYIYFYSAENEKNMESNTVTAASERVVFNGTNYYNQQQFETLINSTCVLCNCQEMWIQEAMLVASLAHCFITLVTTGIQCQKCFINETEQIPTEQKPTTSEKTIAEKCENLFCSFLKHDITVIFFQWLVPLSSILFMCFSLNIFTNNLTVNTEDHFQILIADVLENPMNITNSLQHKQEVDNIVSRVYSIVAQIGNNETNEQTFPKEQDIYKIIDMLEIKSRVPKNLDKEPTIENNSDNYRFKLYTLLFAVFDLILPLMYSNAIYIKSKTCLKFNSNNATQKKSPNELSINTNYLKLSIILATVLWTPSFIDFLSRTLLTNTQPNFITQLLMATGSSYMLMRNGFNLKAIKSTVNQNNHVLPLN